MDFNQQQQQQQPQWGSPSYATNPAYGYVVDGAPQQGSGNTNATYLQSSPPQPGGGKGYAYNEDFNKNNQQYNYNSNNNNGKQPANPYYSNGSNNATDGGGAANGGAPMQGIPLYGDGCDAKAKKFVVQGWKDLWAAILFYLCMAACVGLGCYNFGASFMGDDTTAAPNYDNGEVPPMRDNVDISAGTLVGLIVGMVVLSAVLATLSLFIFHKFPRQAIIGANVATIVLMLLSSALSFWMGSIFSGVITLVFAFANAAILYFYRSRIPFSAILLKACSGITMKYKGLMVANYGIIAVYGIFTMFWSSAVYPSMYRINENNGTANGGDFGILFFAAFCYFWAAQVAFNTMHVTASGVTATWYFVGGDAQMPRNPTVSSFKRAMTTSFGSICFGSLLVAILQFLRYVVRTQRDNDNDFVACIVECLLRCLENLVEYFNHFAFVYCAIYGYDYVTAAKKTFALASNCAFAATFNESLVNTTLMVTSLAAGAIAFLIFWAAANIAVGIVAFFVALFVHVQLFRVIDSATTTMFVCFAEEPNTLATVNSELYEKIYSANAGTATQV